MCTFDEIKLDDRMVCSLPIYSLLYCLLFIEHQTCSIVCVFVLLTYLHRSKWSWMAIHT